MTETARCVDISFNMHRRLTAGVTDDPYASAIYIGRRDALSAFEEKYGEQPDQSRVTLEVQQTDGIISIRLKEIPEESPCGCTCHTKAGEKVVAAAEKFLADPDIGTSDFPWAKK